MLIATIADTHLPRGERRLPNRCVELLRAADLIVHAGDVSTAETLDAMRALGPPLHAVQGNVDCARLRDELPRELRLAVGGVAIGVVHDAGAARGRLARMRRRFPDADAVVFGHSHIPLHERTDGFQIFNPGSPTERRRSPHHTMGLAHLASGVVEFELVILD